MPNPSDTLIEQLPLIERIIRKMCRERGMDSAETEEFAAVAKLKLIEKNYAVIGKFEGRSAFGTFITTVISRMLNDYRNHHWGKWRNSVVAKRMGALAMDLERLLIRDNRSFDEAFAQLSARYPGTTYKTLVEIASRFPARYRPRFTSIDAGAQVAVTDGDIAHKETASRISSIVSAFIAGLPKEDQLIFRFHFEEAVSIPRIALSLHQDAQSIYRRLRKHLEALRETLEQEGIGSSDVDAITGEPGALLDFHLKTGDACPSNDEDEEPEGRSGEDAE